MEGFKAFAGKALLAQLRLASDSASKQAVYQGVRDAYTSEYGWAAELDRLNQGQRGRPAG